MSPGLVCFIAWHETIGRLLGISDIDHSNPVVVICSSTVRVRAAIMLRSPAGQLTSVPAPHVYGERSLLENDTTTVELLIV